MILPPRCTAERGADSSQREEFYHDGFPATPTPPLPAAGQSALWKYKAIYRQGDDRVGQWSDVVSLAVTG